MTNLPKSKFDELIENLEESSNQLIDLLHVAETIKLLSQRQDNLLEEFANSTKEIGQAAINLKQAQQDAVQSISTGFDIVSSQNEKLLSSIQQSVSAGITTIQKEGHDYRGEHEKLLESAEELFLRFDKTQQTGLADLQAETGKVSQLEQQVLSLIKQSADQFRQNSLELNEAVDKVGDSSQAILKLADVAKATEAALLGSVQNEFAELNQQNGVSLTSIKLAIAEKVEKIQKELSEGRARTDAINQKMLDNTEKLFLHFDKTQQAGLVGLQAETGKVSQLEQQVLSLIKQNADQFKRNNLILAEAVDKVNDSLKVTVNLVDVAKTTEVAIVGSIQNELVELGRKNGIAFTSIKLTVAEKIEKIQKELTEGRRQSENTGGDIFNVVTKNSDDNRQFYADFERLLRIKLDENKSEIKQLIEYERNKVQEIVNQQVELSENSIKAQFKQSFDLALKRQQTFQTTIWVISGVLTVLVSAVLTKELGLW